MKNISQADLQNTLYRLQNALLWIGALKYPSALCGFNPATASSQLDDYRKKNKLKEIILFTAFHQICGPNQCFPLW